MLYNVEKLSSITLMKKITILERKIEQRRGKLGEEETRNQTSKQTEDNERR